MNATTNHQQSHTAAPESHHGGDTGGHDKHEGHSPEMFRDRLWVSLALTFPILYFSDQIQDWFNYQAVSFVGSSWVSPVLATFLFVYAGSVFLKGAQRELRDRLPGMMTLISLAISVAYVYSVAVSLGLDGKPFYWEFATLLDVMLLGHWMEMKSIQSASTALQASSASWETSAHRSGDSCRSMAKRVAVSPIVIAPASVPSTAAVGVRPTTATRTATM